MISLLKLNLINTYKNKVTGTQRKWNIKYNFCFRKYSIKIESQSTIDTYKWKIRNTLIGKTRKYKCTGYMF